MIEASDSVLIHEHALWSPIETPAEVEPEGLFLVDEIGRQVTSMRYRDQAEATIAGVQDALYTNPDVAEVDVVGLPDPDRGGRVCVVVVPAPNSAPPTLDDLTQHLTQVGLIRQKHPEQLEVADTLGELDRWLRQIGHDGRL